MNPFSKTSRDCHGLPARIRPPRTLSPWGSRVTRVRPSSRVHLILLRAVAVTACYRLHRRTSTYTYVYAIRPASGGLGVVSAAGAAPTRICGLHEFCRSRDVIRDVISMTRRSRVDARPSSAHTLIAMPPECVLSYPERAKTRHDRVQPPSRSTRAIDASVAHPACAEGSPSGVTLIINSARRAQSAVALP
ncbi:hypothetical protein BV25DRAFT_340554 [Artomyces pyxidatus]|uniref:Uncharacterized protein n=1 Tax=Artomyces pyxidatus TaxID=48021 RepID=A0ACB8T5Q5_9AGAM|nr:hypothetical protein BV25DRAFT_340554 [Artomyces pyxidatus]